jgi:hypothetical protein
MEIAGDSNAHRWELVPVFYMKFSNMEGEVLQYCVSVQVDTKGNVQDIGSETHFGWIPLKGTCDELKSCKPVERPFEMMTPPHKVLASAFLQGEIKRQEKSNTFYLKLQGFTQRAFRLEIRGTKRGNSKLSVKFVMAADNKPPACPSSALVTPTLFEVCVTSPGSSGTEEAKETGWIDSIKSSIAGAILPKFNVQNLVLHGTYRESRQVAYQVVENMQVTEEMCNSVDYKKLMKDYVFQ